MCFDLITGITNPFNFFHINFWLVFSSIYLRFKRLKLTIEGVYLPRILMGFVVRLSTVFRYTGQHVSDWFKFKY